MKVGKPIIFILLFATVFALGGCHTSRQTVRGSDGEVVTGDSRTSVDAAVARRLVDCARGWLGTPYRYGGNDRRGVDCSGLTCNVFSQGADVKIPRDSRSQRTYCLEIDRRALQPGDLVFFVNSPGAQRINHVGLYIGGGEMIHASSSRGVMVSDITAGYWDQRYYASGRVEAVTYAARGSRPHGEAGPEKKSKKKTPKKATKPAPRPKPQRVDDGPTIRVPSPVPEPIMEIVIPASEPDSVLSPWLD